MAEMATIDLRHGDCLTVLRDLPDNSVDSVVCDPPYGLSDVSPAQIADVMTAWCSGDRSAAPSGRGFMGKSWDAFVPPPAVWDECLRVLKPGGHMLVFAGSRTQDLMGLSIRLAGFEIRDSLAWITGSGFPKSHDVSKAIDKAAGAEREVAGPDRGRLIGGEGGVSTNHGRGGVAYGVDAPTAPATPEAERWSGWGTALKPAQEPILLARKPLTGTVAGNVLEWGTGALNIDASRVGDGSGKTPAPKRRGDSASWFTTSDSANVGGDDSKGRWPANVLLDPEAAAAMDQQSGILKSGAHKAGQPRNAQSKSSYTLNNETTYEDAGSVGGASRFFHVFKYQAKAPKKERPVIERPPMLQLRDDLTPEQVDHVRARLTEAGVQVD